MRIRNESRRDFLGTFLATLGGVAAAAVATVGCAPATSTSTGPRSVDGPTEVMPLTPGNYYANVMPDHVAAVRRSNEASTAVASSDVSSSKAFE
jgi:hypothetical protein